MFQDLNESQQEMLVKHLKLVLEANKIHNLTRIDNFEDGMIRHIEDSLATVDIINKIESGDIIDMGSGAGYPGIPLAIATGRKVTLAETVGKKCDCLNSFISELAIESKVSVSNKRIEEIAVQKTNFYKIATARALSSLPSLLELASPLLQINGYLICYKGEEVEEEIINASKICEKLGFELSLNKSYNLPTNIKHKIIVYKKFKDADIRLPRKLGFAQKKPLA